MRSLICPVSSDRIDRTTVRITAGLMATIVGLAVMSHSIFFLIMAAIDYAVRGFTPLPYSAFSWIAHRIARLLRLPYAPQDKAPKIFAARVGFLFALSAAILYVVQPVAAITVALVLLTFALLEAIADLCMGCVVYAHVVMPLLGGSAATSAGGEDESTKRARAA